MPILWRLKDRSWRYSELKKSISHISDRMLSKSLSELLADGFIHKKVTAEVPVKVEYSLTERGTKTIPIISTLRDYGFLLMREDGISED